MGPLPTSSGFHTMDQAGSPSQKAAAALILASFIPLISSQTLEK